MITLLTTVGLPNSPCRAGKRRLVAHHAALAFQAFQQRGLFAADVGSRAAPHFQQEALAAAGQAFAQIARARGALDGLDERALGLRILRAEVDVALLGADGEARDRHALDQRERIAFHEHAVREGARVAFVGVADDVLGRGRGIQHRLPFDAGREGRAATTAQAGIGDLLHDLRAGHFQRGAQAGEAAVRDIVLDTERVDHAHAREAQALLACEIRDGIDGTMVERMRLARQEPCIEQRFDVFRRNRTVGDTPARRLDFDQRLQPVQAARAVATDLHRFTAAQGALLG